MKILGRSFPHRGLDLWAFREASLCRHNLGEIQRRIYPVELDLLTEDIWRFRYVRPIDRREENEDIDYRRRGKEEYSWSGAILLKKLHGGPCMRSSTSEQQKYAQSFSGTI